MPSPEHQIARLEYVVREQMKAIDKLRGEVSTLLDWINGDRDALTTLQSVYTNPASSEGNRIKAAAASLAFERPKLGVLAVIDGGRGDRIVETLRFKQRLIQQGVSPGHPDWRAEPPLIEGSLEPTDAADALRDARLKVVRDGNGEAE
jgi:hypothetical protein